MLAANTGSLFSSYFPLNFAFNAMQDPKGLVSETPDIDTTELDLAEETFKLARAVRSNIQAQEYFIQTQIEEGEVVLMILRKKAEQVSAKLQEADRQLGGARAGLASFGIIFREPPDARTSRHLAVRTAILRAQQSDEDQASEEIARHQSTRSITPSMESDTGEEWDQITRHIAVQSALARQNEGSEDSDGETSSIQSYNTASAG